jgi:predicted acyltransferase (DUF342 family)
MLLGCVQSISAQWASPSPNPNNIYYNSGTVGIGTTSPSNVLTVRGTLQTKENVIRWERNDDGAVAGGLGYYYNSENSVALGSITNHPLHIFTNDTVKMSVLANGNVGIGTASPGNKLVVRGAGAGYNDTIFRVERAADGLVAMTAGFAKDGANSMFLGTATNHPLAFTTNDTERMRIDTAGNVGIGTTSPAYKLDVLGGTLGQAHVGNNADNGLYLMGITGSAYINAGANFNGTNWIAKNATATILEQSSGAFNFYSNSGLTTGNNFSAIQRMTLDASGNLAITGDLNVTGNIKAKYQDVAEWVPSSEQIPAGTVVVLDTTKSNQVITSTQAYDTRVAGVVSETPGIALGESGKGKVLVATTGRVMVKADASNGPIHIGDLLVTSDIPGMAMKSEPITIGNRKMHMPGTLIGKALEPLEKGSGKILVLLSLQ